MDTDELMASLLAGEDGSEAVAFEDGRYVDWSVVNGDEGVSFVVGDRESGFGFDLTWSEVERVQRALTLRLLQRGE